ncbi:unnamed protein product [Mucor hiemalis]
MQSSNYYQPNPQQYMMQPPIVDDSIAVGGGGEEDDSDGSGIPDKRSGRRKIKIEYINDKSRRHITFSKRKAGIMKKAYELSTLTGTQVLLLVVSETGLVYTFTTPKLQPLVTKPEGKNLIQSCLNAPDPIESSTSSSLDHHHQSQQQSQQQNSRSIMSTNAPTSPSTTNNNNYYRSNQNIDSINNSSNSYGDDRRVFKQEDANKGVSIAGIGGYNVICWMCVCVCVYQNVNLNIPLHRVMVVVWLYPIHLWY